MRAKSYRGMDLTPAEIATRDVEWLIEDAGEELYEKQQLESPEALVAFLRGIAGTANHAALYYSRKHDIPVVKGRRYKSNGNGDG